MKKLASLRFLLAGGSFVVQIMEYAYCSHRVDKTWVDKTWVFHMFSFSLSPDSGLGPYCTQEMGHLLIEVE